MIKEEKAESKYFDYPKQSTCLSKKPISSTKAHEIEAIDYALNRLSGMTATQMSGHPYNDAP